MLYISYTREDALLATQLAEDLTSLGLDIWFDLNEIGPETDWAAAQTAAIQASEGVIVVLSPEAMGREHMRHEVSQAFQQQKPVYVAVARRSPWREWLRGLPVADFTESYERGLDALVLLLTGQAGGSPPGQPHDPAEAFLRQAGGKDRPERTPDPSSEKPPKNWLERTLRRLFQAPR